MVDFEAEALAFVESKDETPPFVFLISNQHPLSGCGTLYGGSLTGAVASQRVTEARDGRLRLVGNQL